MKRLYVKNEEEWKLFINKNYFDDSKLNVQCINHANILPIKVSFIKDEVVYFKGGVFTNRWGFVTAYNRLQSGGGAGFQFINSAYDCCTRFVNEDVIYGGVIQNHFGHFLLEGMSRLWYPLLEENSKKKIVFLLRDAYPKFCNEFFKLLGIELERVIIVTEPLQFRTVFVPDESIYSLSCYRDQYLAPYHKIINNVNCNVRDNLILPSKVYLSRKKWKAACITYGEEDIENFYQKIGYTIVYPEELPLEEQIAIVSNCDELVCINGSLGHFALFCRPSTKCIFLVRTDDEILVAQCIVNHATKIDAIFVSVARSFLPSSRICGVCLIGFNEFFRRYVKDTYKNLSIDLTCIEKYDTQQKKYIKKWLECKNDTSKISMIRAMCLYVDYYPEKADMDDILRTEYRRLYREENKTGNLFFYKLAEMFELMIDEEANRLYFDNVIQNIGVPGKNVYLYGAGKICRAFLNYIDLNNIEMDVSAILVSDTSDNKRRIYNYPIIGVNSIEDKDRLVIITIKDMHLYEQIENDLKRLGFSNIAWIFKDNDNPL